MAETQAPTCQGCALWRARVRPVKGEATEYLGYRPCGDGTRRGFRGGQVQGVTGRLLTAPDAGCANHLPLGRGEVKRGETRPGPAREPVPHAAAARAAIMRRLREMGHAHMDLDTAIRRGILTDLDWCAELDRQREAFGVTVRAEAPVLSQDELEERMQRARESQREYYYRRKAQGGR